MALGLPALEDSAMSAPETIDIICPCCQARLTIDPALKAVLHHESPPKKAPSMGLQEALGALKTEANRREAQFQQGLAAEKGKGKVVEKRFEELLKKAKEDRSPPAPRPIDLE